MSRVCSPLSPKTTRRMSLVTALAGSVMLLAAGSTVSACGGGRDEGPKKAVNDGDKRLGVIRFDDKMTRVAPMIIHEPRMDLRTYCLNLRGTAKKQGKDLELCFEAEKRKRADLKTIRVESAPKAKIGQMMQMLMGENEGAHFVIDQTQTIYQVLDLTHAARRDGSYRHNEIRVVSVGDADQIVKLIKQTFGDALAVTHHQLKPRAKSAMPPGPGAKPLKAHPHKPSPPGTSARPHPKRPAHGDKHHPSPPPTKDAPK